MTALHRRGRKVVMLSRESPQKPLTVPSPATCSLIWTPLMLLSFVVVSVHEPWRILHPQT